MHLSRHFAVFAALVLFPASTHGAILWTTSFTGTDNTSRSIVNTAAGAFTGTLTSSYVLGFNLSTPSPAFRTGTDNPLNRFNPNKNVDDTAGAGWNSIFDYNGGSQSILLEDVTFNIYRFNNSGNMQGSDANIRNVLVSAEYTLDGGTSWSPLGDAKTVNLTNSGTATPNIALTFSPDVSVSVDLADDDFRIRYSVVNTGSNVGANTGISSIVFNGSVIPEPSAALLGSLGMVMLLRRRRA